MPTAPYDTLEAVLNTSRVRLNDAIVSVGGDIVTDIAAFTPGVVNAGWRRMQELLANLGFSALNRETILASVPAWTATDQGTFVHFDWTAYFDGTAPQAAPVLPQDMIAPLDLFERVHGLTSYLPMDQAFNGLPTVARGTLNRIWEWRQETIYMPGATGITDIRMRYAGYIADLLSGPTVLTGNMTNASTTANLASGVGIANGNYIQIESEIMLVTAGGGTAALTVTRAQYGTAAVAHVAPLNVSLLPIGIMVPIMRSLNSLAWFICSEVAKARGDMDAGGFDSNAQQAVECIFNRDFRAGKSLMQRSELGKMPDQYSRSKGPAGPEGPEKGNS